MERRFFPAPAGALLRVTLAYAVAIAVAAGALWLLRGWPDLARVAVADFAATVAVFAFSRAFDNSSVYDAYWTVMPMVLVVWLAAGPGAGGDAVRRLVVVALVWAWGARLTLQWARGWQGFGHEDWRYVEFRAKWPRERYWLGSFAAFHLFPTVMTFFGSLPLFDAATSRAPFGALDAVAAVVTAGAIAIQGVADRQLRSFRDRRAADGDRGAACEEGLWRYSRHPNYFGECGLWFGLWLFGVAAAPRHAAWSSVGWVGITLMFVFGTIPMMEKRSLARRPEFARQKERISMLVPWFRRS